MGAVNLQGWPPLIRKPKAHRVHSHTDLQPGMVRHDFRKPFFESWHKAIRQGDRRALQIGPSQNNQRQDNDKHNREVSRPPATPPRSHFGFWCVVDLAHSRIRPSRL